MPQEIIITRKLDQEEKGFISSIKLRLLNNKLLGGTDLSIVVTQDLLDKYFSDNDEIDIADIDYEVDHCINVLVTDLSLNLRYGGDECLYTLAVLLECINGSSDINEFDKCLSSNTPFKDSCSGFIMFILCQLEAGDFIHDTKYRQLTEKGKLLLWLFRHFEFVDTTL